MNTITTCTRRERNCEDTDHARSEAHESDARAEPRAGMTESQCEHAMSVAGGIAGGAFGFGLGSAGGPGVAVAGAVGGTTVGMSMGREIGGAVCGPLMSLKWGELWPPPGSHEAAPPSSDASSGTRDATIEHTAPSDGGAGVCAPDSDSGAPPSSNGATDPPDAGAVCGPSASYYFG